MSSVKTDNHFKCHPLRYKGDKTLEINLLHQDIVKSTIKRIEAYEEESTQSIRQNLLATALRVTPKMSPLLHDITTHCKEILSIEIPIETYVYNSPQFNAACVKPEDGRLFIMFSSSLLQGFNKEELLFVMGHELGHYLFGHHDLPVGVIMNNAKKSGTSSGLSAAFALNLFSWSRMAEISADRAGAACCPNKDAVASALFKLASGITTDIISITADDFLAQADEMAKAADAMSQNNNRSASSNTKMSADWFSTHPFSPLRLKALQEFFKSDLYNYYMKHQSAELRQHIDRNHAATIDTALMDDKVRTVLALMEPTYLESKSPEAEYMRRLLFTGLMLLILQDNKITDAEITKFEHFFGAHSFDEDLNSEALIKALPLRIKSVNNNNSESQKIQVLRDIITVATLDHKISKKEKSFIYKLAEGLNINNAVANTLMQMPTLLD